MDMLCWVITRFSPGTAQHCIVPHAQEIAHPRIHKYTLSPDSTVTARVLAILATVYGREGKGKRIDTPWAHSCYHSNNLWQNWPDFILTRFSPSPSSKAQYTMRMTQGLVLPVLTLINCNTKHNTRIHSDSILAFPCVAFLCLVTKALGIFSSRLGSIIQCSSMQCNAMEVPCVIFWIELENQKAQASKYKVHYL